MLCVELHTRAHTSITYFLIFSKYLVGLFVDFM